MLEPLDALAPVTPDCVTVHEKVAPDTFELKAIDGAVPLQMDAEEGVAVAFGIGLTVMVILTGVPAQPFAVGVTV